MKTATDVHHPNRSLYNDQAVLQSESCKLRVLSPQVRRSVNSCWARASQSPPLQRHSHAQEGRLHESPRRVRRYTEGKLNQESSGSYGDRAEGHLAPHTLTVRETSPRQSGVPVTCRAATTPDSLRTLPAQAGGRAPFGRHRDGAGAGLGAETAPAPVPVSGRHAPSRGSAHQPASMRQSSAADCPLLPLPISETQRTSGERVVAGRPRASRGRHLV